MNKKTHKNPVMMASRSFYFLGVFELIIGLSALFVAGQFINAIILSFLAVLMLVSGYLLSKNNIFGVYLCWFYVVVTILWCFLSDVSVFYLIISVLVGFYSYKAYNFLKLEKNNN